MPDRQAGSVPRHRAGQDPGRRARRRRGRAHLSTRSSDAELLCHGSGYSELYDLFYRDKDYRAEAAHVHALFVEHRPGACRDLLELACGTGEHAFALEALGHRIVATDRSPHMIAQAAAKAVERGSRVAFHTADMRDVGGLGEFDGVYCLFDSLGFVETDAGIAGVLRRVHDALRPGGLFVFEFLNAPTMLRDFDPVRVRRFETPEGEVVRIAETSVDAVSGVCAIRFTVFRPQRDGQWTRTEEVHRNRALGVDEAAALLAAAGMSALEWCDGYRFAPVGEGTWHVVGVAQKAPETEAS